MNTQNTTQFVFAKIYDTVMLIDRGTKYEDPLNELLQEQNLGEVTGGGTMQNKDGSIQYIGVDIELTNLDDALQVSRKKLRELGAPKGSVLEYEQDGKQIVLPIHDN